SSPNAGCRTGGKGPAAGNLSRATSCRSRGANELRPEPGRLGLGPACRHLRGQNFERREAGRSPHRAAKEVRIHHQPESGEADRAHDSAECAGESGQSHSIGVRSEEKPVNRKKFALTLCTLLVAPCSLLLAPCFSAAAPQPGKIARIGFLDASTASGMAVLVEAFQQELTKLGWI